MNLTLLNDDAIFLNGIPQGTLTEFLAKHPDKASDYIAALRARVAGESEVNLVALRAQLASAQAALDLLRTEKDAVIADLQGQLSTLGAIVTARDQALAEADTTAKARATRLDQLERRVGELVGLYEPKPYFQVHALPEPFNPKLRPKWAEVTHVGCRRPPEIGGTWTVDLLREMGANQFARVAAGIEIPAAAQLTSYTEVDGPAFETDLSTWFTAQNTKS